jgi:hypothetical protein
MKQLLLFLAIVLVTACTQDEPVLPDVITYEIKMNATIPVNGRTNFTLIKYNNANGQEVRVENSTTSFSQTIVVSPPFNFLFEVKATNDFDGIGPDLPISYSVKRLVNGEDKGIFCAQEGGSKFGGSGSWNYSSTFSRLIDVNGCK